MKEVYERPDKHKRRGKPELGWESFRPWCRSSAYERKGGGGRFGQGEPQIALQLWRGPGQLIEGARLGRNGQSLVFLLWSVTAGGCLGRRHLQLKSQVESWDPGGTNSWRCQLTAVLVAERQVLSWIEIQVAHLMAAFHRNLSCLSKEGLFKE